MEHTVTEAEINRAKSLHSVLLFDFIVIHVFIFVLALSMLKTSIVPITIMPILSLALLGNVIFRARRAVTQEESMFVLCHNLLAEKRAKLFMLLFIVTGTLTAILVFGGTQLGMSKITSWALAVGIGQLPFMVILLVLVVLEFDAEHQCKDGKIPAAALKLHAALKKA
ncbi:MAG: hypothetical protein A2342_05385 [Gallionellales bacterium RIFOXYB12_FULL_54_9]|nr:MAG: hypothetical protein A2342_05385 [Gallionellales bacterium RIFOXYB12_FULL_54_9]